ncbi:PLP-dependent aminotransferase family protein [Pokkaliibacter plantistimulans]|uniref:aminotransferase-like domain-containing protein n=1 Tax=Pokkaliibacter plantistimulans TaxID=1635171 RepID=UPI0011B04AE6|nr:PLP-dependent aminotransferase family protein [Pokkaliibacter plantistimulans]
MLYQQVAEQLAEHIRTGVFAEGERIPSIRKLHQQWGVSQSTALAALSALEAQGLIEARPRSGFYVKALPERLQVEEHVPAPVAVSRHQLINHVLNQSRQPGLMHLGAAVPETVFLPQEILRRISNRCLREQPGLITDYAFPPGNKTLRQQIAVRMQAAGCSVSASELLITQGCQEALSLCLRVLAQPGDLIAIESPAYHGLLQALEALGLQALEIPCDPARGMDLEALAAAIQEWPVKACVVSANFSNPTGSLMPDEHKQRLVSMLSEAQIPLVEDDTYADLHYGRRQPHPLKAWDREGNVLYCSAFSKTIAPGFRVGWVAGGRYHQQLQQLLTVTTMASHALSQQVMAEYLHSGDYDRHLRKVRRQYRQQLHNLVDALYASGLPVAWSLPQGGFLLWLILPAEVDALAVYEQMLQKGISVMPGSLFSASERFRHCMRISIAVSQPDWSLLVAALRGSLTD